jgi:recombination protein RecT
MSKNTDLLAFENQMVIFTEKILNDLLLSHHIPPAQFKQVVISEIKNNPKLLSAFMKNPRSLFASIIYCAELGLSPNSNLGEFFFVTDGEYVKPLLGYKGIITLLNRTGNIKSIWAESVHEGDDFEYELGLEPKLYHKPKDGIRNAFTLDYIYIVVKTMNDEKLFKVMSKAELNNTVAIMPIPSDMYFNDAKDPNFWMLKKIALKQLAKLLPKDNYGTMGLGIDDKIEGGNILTLDENESIVVTPIAKPSKFNKNKRNIYQTLVNSDND